MSTTPTGTPDPSGIDLDYLERHIAQRALFGYSTAILDFGEIRTLIRLSRAKEEVERERNQFRNGLEAAVKLLSDYAWILNDYDGGLRRQFGTVEQWLNNIAALPKETPSS